MRITAIRKICSVQSWFHLEYQLVATFWQRFCFLAYDYFGHSHIC